MAVHLRLSRGGSKKRPFFSIVAAESRAPRDGRFIEKLGTYNPLLAADDAQRLILNADRLKYWLGVGAQPTEKVARFLGQAGIAAQPARSVRPQKSAPKAKAQERAKAKAEKNAAPAEGSDA